MGDEKPVENKRRQASRRSKIIITKCKKSANTSKTVEDDKKVNGELTTEKEGKDVNTKSLELEIIEEKAPTLKKPPTLKKAVTTRTSRKRSVSESVTDSDIIVLDDDDDDDASVIIEDKTSNTSDGKVETPSVEFKGFKKRILAQTEKLKINEQGKSDPALDPQIVQEKGDVSVPVRQKVIKLTKVKKKAINVGKKGNEGDSDENQGESQTEYAQYLGLQPTMQFKCYRCGERGFPSMLALNMHQRGCGVAQKNNLIANLQQDTMAAPSDPNMLTNFRITRKVYLCSACGTYYENWNLFLHMRDVHKKHICLFCLTMFGVADKLADHLKMTHSVQEATYDSSEDFQNVYQGSCYLICCTCENMFSERDNFFNHHCEKRDPTAKCTLCGVKCGHYFTCPNSNTQKHVGLPANVVNLNPTSITCKNQTSGLTKYTGVKNKSCEDHWMGQGKKNQGVSQSDSDDLYDISDAASFCHVALADDSGEHDKTVPENSLMEVAEVSDKVSTVEAPSNKECKGPPEINTKTDSNGADDQIQPIGNEHNQLDIIGAIIPPRKSSEKTKLDQQEVLQKETPVTENSVAENEKPDIDINIVIGGSLIDINQQTESADKNKEESKSNSPKGPLNENSNISRSEDEDSISNMQKSDDAITNTQQSNDTTSNEKQQSDDIISKVQQSEGISDDDVEKSENTIEKSADISNIEKSDDTSNIEMSKDAISNKQKTEDQINNAQKALEADLDDKLHPIEKSRRNENESSSSESDGEPVAQLSVSQDDSESSSEESSDEDSKSKDEQSVESKKETPLCESEDSDTSGLVVDEKPKTTNGNDKDIEKTCNYNTPEDKDSSLDTKNTESNDASKDFQLDTVPSTEKEVENDNKESESTAVPEEISNIPSPEISDGIPLASEDVPAMALTLEDKLEEASSQSVVKECVRTSCQNCVYCSHAIKIAVNGKQLALHLLAEHRYKPVKNNETSKDLVKKLKTSLDELEQVFFNTDSYDSSDKSQNITYDYTYECFQCRFVTSVHKELYVHKRKMHQKTVLLCVMCKSNFYSYSELLCHMCPGIYVSEDIKFRCCLCNLDMIPSAFRLMVHLRKTHHTCDICLEVAGDQQKLSTHMWKHKLNHLCYRCGIAYRNKPDITKHLFWKHGTESVLCKKCLQKKWPHVYHFCIPPTSFICEECNASFTKAVALKVHKRFHIGELPYGCTECAKRFVSKKLLLKHEDSHKQPPPAEKHTCKTDSENKQNESADEHINVDSIDDTNVENIAKNNSSLEASNTNEDPSRALPESKSKKRKKKGKDTKPVLDVYDLPPLNLSSESDSSDGESANPPNRTENQVSDTLPQPEINETNLESNTPENVEPSEENQVPVPIVDGVWDNFHSYKAELEKRESKDLSLPNILPSSSSSTITCQPEIPVDESPNVFLLDHCYCLIPGKPKPNVNEEGEDKPEKSEATPVEETSVEELKETPAPRGHSSSIDHAYATLNSSNADGVPVPTLPQDEKPSTPLPPDVPPAETNSSSKKKQKTPKKKKQSANSSSSSDSSSDSDSTDCTCGGNCSCSNSSSSSSSSSSSDSDSSTSEGRRRVAARREKKKERLKHKHHKEEPLQAPAITPHSPPKEEPVVDIPVEPIEEPIKESDLDTDESSTDEDFYDKYPQSHARQQLEKRNKLMLLASVAPVNNGTVSPPPSLPPVPAPPPPPPPPVEEELSPPTPTVKRKIKTKRRKKSQQSKKSANKATTPVHTQPSTSSNFPNATSTPDLLSNHQSVAAKTASSFLRTTVSTMYSDATGGSGSENESARLSKRKRVRNKFYGYSSEEEDGKPNLKWRKVEPAPVPQSVGFQPTLTIQRPQLPIMSQAKKPEPSESSATDEEPNLKKDTYSNSSSSSSESDNEVDSKQQQQQVQKEQTEKSDNLYCYCQCPYDEVSEMIACDGQDCTIEWFHFECVGIMVPPKGKWYCPDCRKRRDLM